MKTYKIYLLTFCCFFIFAQFVIIISSVLAHESWEIEVIEQTTDAGQYSSIALDANNQLLVTYYDVSGQHLKYAAFDGNAWKIETIDHDEHVGLYSSFLIDPAGRKSLVYYDTEKGALKYAGWVEPVWKTDLGVIDHDGDVGQYSALALDARDQLTAIYYDVSNQHLKYAYFCKGQWLKTILDENGDVGQYASFVINANGRENLVYYDVTRGALKFAGWFEPVWKPVVSSVEEPDKNVNVGQYSSLAIDPQRRLNVSYYDVEGSRLKYALFDGQDWQAEIVDDFGDLGHYSSLLIDFSGKRDLIYYDATRGGLRYAGGLESLWKSDHEVIENTKGKQHVGQYPSIAIDEQNRLQVGYYDVHESQLKYASRHDNEWQIEVVDNFGDLGQYGSLTIDHTGKRSLTYYDARRGGLKYAGWLEPLWQSELGIVEKTKGEQNVGQYSSIVVDSLNRLHLTYYDSHNTQLKYSLFSEGKWQNGSIDNSGDVGQYSSLIIASEQIFTSYYDANEGRLKFAILAIK